MDGLDLLKKDWNKQDTQATLKAKDILPMLHKKSSSIVKTLFYISIAELVFWILVNTIPYFTSDTYRSQLDKVYSDGIMTGLSIFSYAVILVFIFLLYKAYKSISVTDNARRLMKSIINTRKIIKYYVLYNLIMVAVSFIIGFYYSSHYDPNVMKAIESAGMTVYIIISVLVSVVFIVIIWLFYRLIYGLLLKRLNKNYNELKKLEV